MQTQPSSVLEPELEPEIEVEYPDSDGQPMAESDQARDLMMDCIQTLEDHFAGQPDVYVSGNLLLYYQKGNPKKCVAPDVLVARGVEKKKRPIYKTWVEGRVPEVMIELLSKSTWFVDLTVKTQLYARLGVKEYYVFDWTGRRLDQRLNGFLLEAGEFQPREPDERGRFSSQSLGLELGVEGKWLRFYDVATGQRLRTPREKVQEAESRAEAAEGRAQEEEALRQAAEQRLLQLEEELRQLRAGGGA